MVEVEVVGQNAFLPHGGAETADAIGPNHEG